MKFDRQYQDQVDLPGQGQVRFRLVRPDDKKHLRTGFAGLSESSRQKRFMGGKHGLSEAELVYLTELDEINHFALGAVEVDVTGEETNGIGIACFIRLPDEPASAEVALTVVDRAQGRGIGRELLERLVEAAVERGIERFRFECLPHNHEIQQLVDKTCDVVDLVSDGDLMAAEVVLPGRHLKSREHSLDAFERLFTLLRSFATDAMTFHFNAGMGSVRRSIDMALDKRHYWVGQRKGRATRDTSG